MFSRIAGLFLAVLVGLSAGTTPAVADGDNGLNSGRTLYERRQYREALKALAPAVEANKEPTSLYYAGLCFQQLGDMTHAMEAYSLIEKYFPGSREAQMARPVLSRHGVRKPAPAVNASSAATVLNLSGTADGGVSFLRNYSMSDAEWKTLPDEVKVPFKRSASSHLFVSGTVNGRPIEMMFDTGAEQCHFHKALLENAGVKVEPIGPKIPIQGVGGISYSQAMMADIGVGDLHRKIPILVDDVSAGMPIIGETFFKEFRYDIDNGGGFIKFAKKPRAGMTTHSFEPIDVIAVPYEPLGDNMIVQAKVNGVPYRMIFDTGSFAICFSALQAAELGIRIPSDARMMVTSGAGGRVMAYTFNLPRLELGPICKTNIPIVVNQADTPVLPLLGQPFYKDRRFTVDTEKHLIKFVH